MKQRSIGQCIYCGALGGPPGEPLSNEHVIPEGMGGDLQLQAASCASCAQVTSAFEGSCLRGFFAQTRSFLNAYGERRRSTRPQEFDARVTSGDGTQSPVSVPLSVNPYWLVMLLMPPPGVLVGRSVSQDQKELLCHPVLISERISTEKALGIAALTDELRTFQSTVTMVPRDFWRLLAKIGYGYSVLEMGVGAFTPYLNDFILGNDTEVGSHYVGGAYSAEELPILSLGSIPELHEVRLFRVRHDTSELVVVRLQLFAPLVTPVYDVVVGIA